jgi:hypothetical protein
MIRAARAKAAAAGVNVEFQQGDAADSPVAPASVAQRVDANDRGLQPGELR